MSEPQKFLASRWDIKSGEICRRNKVEKDGEQMLSKLIHTIDVHN
jgi:hypothetical protein